VIHDGYGPLVGGVARADVNNDRCTLHTDMGVDLRRELCVQATDVSGVQLTVCRALDLAGTDRRPIRRSWIRRRSTRPAGSRSGSRSTVEILKRAADTFSTERLPTNPYRLGGELAASVSRMPICRVRPRASSAPIVQIFPIAVLARYATDT